MQEAYYDMLVKYREELTRPLQEAMDFMRRIESQLNVLTNGPVRIFNSGTFFSFFLLIYSYMERERVIFHGHCLSWKEQAEE